MEKVSLVNQQSTQTSLEDLGCTKLLIFNFHFLNFPLYTRYHVIRSSIHQDEKKKEFLALSLTATCKHNPESKLFSSVGRTW